MAANPQFFEIKNQDLINKILTISVKHKVAVTFWVKNQTVKAESKFAQYLQGLGKLHLECPKDFKKDEFITALKSQGNEIMGSQQIDNVNFFFRTKVTETSDNWLTLEIPTSFFKMQRRSHLRIAFLRRLAPKLSMLNPLVEYDPKGVINDRELMHFRILDVSAGGVAIAAVPEQKDILKVGVKCRLMTFKLKDQEVIVDGVIRFAKEMQNDLRQPMLKIGIQFENLKPNYEQILARFTLEESRKMFSLLF